MTQVEQRVLKIGTRSSALARTQAGHIRDALLSLGFEAELHFVSTPGDASQSAQTPVERIGVGVFTETLRTALSVGECDIAVHSFKDLPTAPAPAYTLIVPPRVDPREVIISRDNKPLAELPEGAIVGTGAPRRISQIRAIRPDLILKPLRGNIDTRMGRVDKDMDAVILARAGVERVGLLHRTAESIDPLVLMPAPAQGALAVEARVEDDYACQAIAALDDPYSHAQAVAERSVLSTLEAGCTAPVAAYSVYTSAHSKDRDSADIAAGRILKQPFSEQKTVVPPELHIYGGVFSLDGTRRLLEEEQITLEGEPGDWNNQAQEAGQRIGQALLHAGAAELYQNPS